MFRKNYFTLLLAIVLFTVGNIQVFAQSGLARGVVQIKKADGTVAPVADAVIDIFRTDIAGKLPSGKTNKKGEFTILGLLPGGRYALAISAPGITSDVFPDIKAGDEKLTINVVEGNGVRLTDEEVRKLLANAPKDIPKSGELTAEQKKAQEEFEKKNAEIAEKNKNIENINAIVSRSLKEGNEQFNAKNYDAAIARYDEGINADPEFAPSASVLLNKKASALIIRGLDKSNETLKSEPAVRMQALVSVKKDFEDAIVSLDKSLALIKNSNETDPKLQKDFADIKLNDLEKRKEAYRLLAKTGADRSRGKDAHTAFQEYIDALTDPKVKTDMQLSLAETLQESNEFDLAIVEFEKILAADPNNVDALAGISLSLVNVGYITLEKNPAKGKEQFQQAANYLQKYLDLAPDTHKYKAEAKGIIDTLKNEQGVTSQKGSKTTKKKQ
jgi:tetratricopeptide (TPR) repeat protein